MYTPPRCSKLGNTRQRKLKHNLDTLDNLDNLDTLDTLDNLDDQYMSRCNKRKRNLKTCKNKNNKNDDDDNDDDGDLKPFKFPSLFNNNTDDEVYVDKNHIYFKTDVTKESIDKLATKIDYLNNKINNVQNACMYGKINPHPIYLHITTNGGDLLAGFYGYDKIKSSLAPIHTIIEGCVASAGSLLSIAGSTRYITPNSHLLIHQLRTGLYGTYDNLVDEKLNCDHLMSKLLNLYYDNCKKTLTKTKIKEILKRDIFWNANTSILNGFVDEQWLGNQHV